MAWANKGQIRIGCTEETGKFETLSRSKYCPNTPSANQIEFNFISVRTLYLVFENCNRYMPPSRSKCISYQSNPLIDK